MVYQKLNKVELFLAILITISIILFYLLFNLNYLSSWVDEKGDVKTYNYYVKLGIPEYLYNPHHIAFDWLGKVFYNTFKNNGYTGPSMHILQLRNLIISSIALGLLFFLFFKISKKIYLSLSIVLMIAFSCAFWIYSQINDTPIIHSVLIALLFFLAIYFPQAKNKILYSIFLGIFHAVTIFFHQTDILFMFIIAFIILLAQNFKITKNNRELELLSDELKLQSSNNFRIYNIKYFIIYFFTFSIIVISAYYYVGVVLIGLTLDPAKAETFHNFKGGTYFFNWLILYTKINYWGKGYQGNTLQKVLYGISTYFYQPQTINNELLKVNFNNFFSINSVLPNVLVIFCSGVLSLGLIFSKYIYKKYRFVILSNILFLIIYIAFACWWEPDYREFWVAPMFSFWFLSFFILNYITDKANIGKYVIKFFIYSFLSLTIFLLFYFNFFGIIYPNAYKNYRHFEIVKSMSVFNKLNVDLSIERNKQH